MGDAYTASKKSIGARCSRDEGLQLRVLEEEQHEHVPRAFVKEGDDVANHLPLGDDARVTSG